MALLKRLEGPSTYYESDIPADPCLYGEQSGVPVPGEGGANACVIAAEAGTTVMKFLKRLKGPTKYFESDTPINLRSAQGGNRAQDESGGSGGGSSGGSDEGGGGSGSGGGDREGGGKRNQRRNWKKRKKEKKRWARHWRGVRLQSP